MIKQPDHATVFKPRLSIAGWIFSILLPAAMALLLWAILQINNRPVVLLIAGAIICSLLLAVFLFFLAIYPTMRYYVSDDSLLLICGPFRWSIPKSDIRSIEEKDLACLSFSEGWKLPGYALFSIHYGGGRDPVRMCATAVAKNIMLLRTPTDTLGITPSDPEAFRRELKIAQ
jgi:hypothetical protein